MKYDYSRDDKLTDFAKETLRDRYLYNGETFQEMFGRVALAFSDDDDHAQRLYDYMSKLWFMPATPVLSNGGTDRGLPISCFLNNVEDSMQGISDTWTENVWLACRGGGIGTDWSKVRSIGEPAGRDGKTSGVVPFIKAMDAQTLAVSQGLRRRGSAAVYLHISHPEIEEFIEIRRPTGGDPNRKCLNIHNAVVIPDAFMRAVEQGKDWDLVSPKSGDVISTVSARGLWQRLLHARIETGEPYIMFEDTVRNRQPAHHKALGLRVTQSNLCVAPETMVLTDQGQIPIRDLEDQVANVWNGHEWSEVTIRKTGQNQRLIVVELSDGTILECTPYHKFYLQDGAQVQAEDLIRGYQLLPTTLPDGAVLHRMVMEVWDAGRADDTYCFSEPKRHMGVFNGVLTGQCQEIYLPTGKDHLGDKRTAVCCLSSLNLETYDEWEPHHDQLVKDVMKFLDNVLQDFIDRTEGVKGFENARYSAMRERSIGLGVMGWHSLLMKRGIPFEGVMAKSLNTRIWKRLKEAADEVNYWMGMARGACPDAQDVGHVRRFSHIFAVAPTASISTICGGASPGIEPIVGNSFVQKTLSGNFVVRNKHLVRLLEEKGQNTDGVWSSITTREGSVQHLDFLTDLEKAVFRTAFEMDQRWIIEHAADRAPYICQGQSVNVFLPGDVEKAVLHAVHWKAWKDGVKGLYYCRSKSVGRAEVVSHTVGEMPDYHAEQRPAQDAVEMYEECLACT